LEAVIPACRFIKPKAWQGRDFLMHNVGLNISEGSIGQTNPEFKRFMSYSIRSLAEVVTCLHKAQRRDYISDYEFKKLYETAYNIMNMMIAFKNKIN